MVWGGVYLCLLLKTYLDFFYIKMDIKTGVQFERRKVDTKASLHEN